MLRSAIFVIVFKVCVRAYNIPTYNLEPGEQILNTFPLPIYDETPLIRQLCLNYNWKECSDSFFSGTGVGVYNGNIPQYQPGPFLTKTTLRPNIILRTKRPQRQLLGNNMIKKHDRFQQKPFPMSPIDSQKYNNSNKLLTVDKTQSLNKPFYNSSQDSKRIKNYQNDILNTTTERPENSKYVNESFVNETETQTTERPEATNEINKSLLRDTLNHTTERSEDSNEVHNYFLNNSKNLSEPEFNLTSDHINTSSDEIVINKHTKTLEVLTSRKMDYLLDKFSNTLDIFERKFYEATFTKLSSISPIGRRENGISFIQSGLIMYLMLTILSMDVDTETKMEIQDRIGLYASDDEKLQLVEQVMKKLPASNDELKFRLKSRLVMASNVTCGLRSETAAVAHLELDRFNVTDTPELLTKKLNKMVEVDSGSAMRDTFDESDLSEGVRAVLMSTVYMRARWRSAPTLLNGTRPFHDAQGAPERTVRMFRINDIMRYADLREFDAEAIEIPYESPDLSLLLLVPRGRSLRKLSELMFKTPVQNITRIMQTMRLAVSVPLYTLRMTLLLPNKLQYMGISRIVNTNEEMANGTLRISHAIQRLMFWAEAGRNAFKDDGFEWDEHPEMELVVDRPYIFFVRWKNLTLINGHFVL